MKPWENVKRGRHRRKLLMYIALVIGIFVAIVAVSNLQVAGPAKTVSLDTPSNRNDKRKADLGILQAAFATYLTNHPSLPYTLPISPTQICSVATVECKKVKLVDLNYLVTSNTGLASIPTDPVGGPGYGGNGYTVMMGSDGRIVLAAPRAESDKVIELRIR